jgi:hypothetical protein
MTFRDGAGTLLAGVAWLLFGAVLFSLGHSPEAAESCHPDALWTGGWFFVPPVLAAVTLFATRRRVARIGGALVLALWVFILPIYFLFAIANGASCGGG